MSSSVKLKEHGYGKSGVRLVKVERHGSRHDLKDVNIDIQLLGAFEDAYWQGDNRRILPTDSMKNAVYALAKREHIGEIEEFGLRLANHFLASSSHVSSVHVTIYENIWHRIQRNGAPHDHAFRLSGPERRAALVERSRTETSIRAKITDLAVLKTARSAFENFLHDEYTTLKETNDRILGTSVKAEWSYSDRAQNFGELWNGVRATLLDTFAAHDSRSAQHTLCAMGEAVLQRFDCIGEIYLCVPNRHCLLVDLSPFDMENPNEVFAPTDETIGLIEATLARDDS